MVDASAAVAALLHAGPARAALSDDSVHLPHLADAEVLGVLRRQVAKGRLGTADGRSALEVWRRLGATRYPMTGLLGRMWELRDQLSAYDATYVALAEYLGTSLLTADARIAHASGLRCPVTVVPR